MPSSSPFPLLSSTLLCNQCRKRNIPVAIASGLPVTPCRAVEARCVWLFQVKHCILNSFTLEKRALCVIYSQLRPNSTAPDVVTYFGREPYKLNISVTLTKRCGQKRRFTSNSAMLSRFWSNLSLCSPWSRFSAILWSTRALKLLCRGIYRGLHHAHVLAFQISLGHSLT